MTPFLLLLLLYAILGAGGALQAQVAPLLTIRGFPAEGATIVRNPSRETVDVDVALWFGHVHNGHVELERAVIAVVSPTAFTLAPGETQTVRIRLVEGVPPGETLRLVTTFTPMGAYASAPGSETTAVARLVTVTRLITKVRVGPE